MKKMFFSATILNSVVMFVQTYMNKVDFLEHSENSFSDQE